MKKTKTTKHKLKTQKHSTKKYTKPISLPKGQILPYQTPDCGEVPNDPLYSCKIVCPYDYNCQILGFNRTKISCGCGAQICKNKKLYGFPSYTKGKKLNNKQIALQPHIIAPCNCTIPAEIAPYHRAIHNETCEEMNNITTQANSPDQANFPSQENSTNQFNPPDQANPPDHENYYSLSDVLDQTSNSSTIE